MIDPMTSLAFNVFSNRGIYALLLGSGVSRAALIPTGWEVVLDLIRKWASIQGDAPDDPVAWYREKTGKEPDYSEVVKALAKTKSERNGLLRSYFEPTEEERLEGKKMPTEAHRAIANLVAKGYIKVILTTNFDRLLEKALDDRGISATVVKSPDDIKGCLPLPHCNCLVVKLNGDYMDTRIKNTERELSTYEDATNKLLERIFDEYGLIVSGWSSEWDIALRDAIRRCANRRFSTFWTVRTEPNEAAQDLIKFKKAEEILINDADGFFATVDNKITALEAGMKTHPVSKAIAIATVKRYLSDNIRYKIDLNDLIMDETEKVCSFLAEEKYDGGDPQSIENYRQRLLQYEARTEILRSVLVVGSFWAGVEHVDIWKRCIMRLLSVGLTSRDGFEHYLCLRVYPALLCFYICGINSIASEQYEVLAQISQGTVIVNREKKTIGKKIDTTKTLDYNFLNKILGQSMKTPRSIYLQNLLKPDFNATIRDAGEFETFFDRFEYLWGLESTHLFRASGASRCGTVGQFSYRHEYSPEMSIMSEVDKEYENIGKEWLPLRAGLFGGDPAAFEQVKTEYDQHLVRRGNSF